MPFVRIDLFEGRTLEQKKALAKEVTEAVVRNTGAPQSAVHVIINDMTVVKSVASNLAQVLAFKDFLGDSKAICSA